MKKIQQQRIILTIVICSLIVCLLVGFTNRSSRPDIPTNLINVAHRGASGFAPENTQASFRKGIEMGADFLEFDVHLSKDGEPVIIHDERVDRTTNGKGFVKDLTLAELKELDVGGSFDPVYTGETILTLDELLEEFYGEAGLLIEIKKPDQYPGIEEKVVEALTVYPDVSGIIIQSFDIDSMRKVHALLPEVEVAVLMNPSPFLPSSKTLKELTSFASYINFNVSYVNKRVVDQVHKHDGKVLVWSKKDTQLFAKAKRFGADGVISDFSKLPMDEPAFLATK